VDTEAAADPGRGVEEPNITESAPSPRGLPFALFRGRYYSVADTPWDRRGFATNPAPTGSSAASMTMGMEVVAR
jgi:hypothetical protein